MNCESTMRCEEVRDRLDDYVDTRLSDQECVLIEEHLAACAECRRELDTLDALWEQTKALPRRLMPARDLWQGIEARLANSRPRGLVGGLPWFMQRGLVAAVAAAAVVLIGALGILGWFARAADAPAVETPTVQAPTAQVAVEETLAKEIQNAETEYAVARQNLLDSLAQCEASLSPETRQVIEQNLAVIDGAVVDIRTRLAQEPANAQLLYMLVTAQQQGLDLVRLAIRLSTET